MKKVFAVTAVLALLGLSMATSSAITIDTVTVGDPGNAADTRVMSDYTAGYGSVAYTYNIGKYEVTASQYTAFLNAVAKTDTYGLYNANMAGTSGSGITRSGSSGSFTYTVDSMSVNRPVDYVSFWDACRFANWLSNGQKSGAQDATTTEDGTYTLSGYNGGDGRTIQRKAGWQWAITSENEWYKGAYYSGGGTSAGYWLYPTQSNTAPGRDLNDVSGNNANYFGDPCPIQSPYFTTVVGEFQSSESAYGTFDQGGNLWEWNETVVRTPEVYAYRGLRGGSLGNYDDHMQSSYRDLNKNPTSEYLSMGFRVVQVVPEPSSIIALFGGLTGLIWLRRRRC